MNPTDIITLNFLNHGVVQKYRCSTLRRLSYFDALLKDEWAQGRDSFDMEEDPATFLAMMQRVRSDNVADLADFFGAPLDRQKTKEEVTLPLNFPVNGDVVVVDLSSYRDIKRIELGGVVTPPGCNTSIWFHRPDGRKVRVTTHLRKVSGYILRMANQSCQNRDIEFRLSLEVSYPRRNVGELSEGSTCRSDLTIHYME